MSEEKDVKFKVTDRRKFNADGTAREQVVQSQEARASSGSVETSGQAAVPEGPVSQSDNSAEQARITGESGKQSKPGNVVSFPGQQAAGSPAAPQGAGAAAQATTQQSAEQTPQQKEAERAYAQTSAGQKHGMPPATFLAIVNMLGIEAAMQLGMVQMPGHEEAHIDLEAGRHMIDLLGVLRQKTRGNLTAEEDHVMENLLADLRMQYVSLCGRR